MSRRRPGVAVAAALALAGCSGTGDDDAALTVFAAASLAAPYAQLAPLFAADHPEVELTFSYAGSSELVAQVVAGAPADVLATADEATMADAVAAGAVAGEPTVVATNHLTLITPDGNPAGVTGLDESLDDAALVVCAPQVPCGAATSELAERLGAELAPVSEEGSVTDVLGKVTSGAADAGIVYPTEAARVGDAVEVIPVPGAEEVVNRYPAAVVADAESPELAAQWVEFLAGPDAQEVFRAAGFGAP